jgi:putative colanic acid biosynthesis acetyltransferase WcaF
MGSHYKRLRTLNQAGRYTSPWSVRSRLGVLLWQIVWLLFFRPTPKQLYRWRTFLLRLFGCRITGVPYVAPSAIIRSPSKLVLEDRACLGPQSEVYNLATVTLRARATVSQQAYLCAGTHDFSDPGLPLVVGEIEIGEDAFVGARAFVLPGLVVGSGAIAGACAVVTRDVEPWAIVAGNPAKVVGRREMAANEVLRSVSL